MWSLTNIIDVLAPRLSPDLVASERFGRVLALARALPAHLTRCVYLELWLQEHPTRIDLIVRVDPRGRGHLTGATAPAIDGPWTRSPAWRRIITFARQWIDDAVLDRGVEALWLEFDLDAAAEIALQQPRIFVDLTPEAQTRPLDERLALIHRVLDPLRDPPLAAAERERIRHCVSELPARGRVLYLGASPADPASPVRVCVNGLGHDLVAYLGALGWPGDPGDLDATVLTPLREAAADTPGLASMLHMDVTAEIAPRIGLEYAFSRASQRQGALLERGILEHLVTAGWCRAPLIDELVGWPGRGLEWLAHDIWQSQLARRVSHVKVTYEPHAATTVKAYLCAFFELQKGGTLIDGRHFVNAAEPTREAPAFTGPAAGHVLLSNSARAPLVGPALGRTQHDRRDLTTSRHVMRGAGFAYWTKPGGSVMEMSSTEQRALEAVLQRASVDLEFRRRLLASPRQAIQEAYGVSIPANFRVKFIERDPDVDALIVLPDMRSTSRELSDDSLEAVAGGSPTGPEDPTWSDGIPNP